MTAFYNEHDSYVAQYLRNLIAAGLIAPGVVDERDIQDIEAWELLGYTQVHMFAGVGIWSGALRAAGWPDDEPIWTGSAPCQPFSNAGLRKGIQDDRHLFPVWRDLIAQCKPPVVVGEQVASKDGKLWLDTVSVEMEALGFAFGAADLCAAGFGGAHIRQRNYFVGLADTSNSRRQFESGDGSTEICGMAYEPAQCGEQSGSDYNISGLADDDDDARLQGWAGMPERGLELSIGPGGLDGGLADRTGERRDRTTNSTESPRWRGAENRRPASPNFILRDSRKAGSGYWHDVDWLLCRNLAGEPSWRPVESGTFPLAHGITDRMGKLRAYGNALDFETAKNFCEVVAEICLRPVEREYDL